MSSTISLRRGVSDRKQVHVVEQTGDSGRIEWRVTCWGSFKSKPGLVQGSGRASGRDGHVAVSEIHDWLELDCGLWSSEANEAEFKALYAYSPIHNVKPGTKYPATLITTADHDDRVVPAHNFKYAAALQAAQGGMLQSLFASIRIPDMEPATRLSPSSRREIFLRSCLRTLVSSTGR